MPFALPEDSRSKYPYANRTPGTASFPMSAITGSPCRAIVSNSDSDHADEPSPQSSQTLRNFVADLQRRAYNPDVEVDEVYGEG